MTRLRHRRGRAGIAPMEFLLVLPFLIGLVAAIFIIARTASQKNITVVSARYHAWRGRLQANPVKPLHVDPDPLASQVEFFARNQCDPATRVARRDASR